MTTYRGLKDRRVFIFSGVPYYDIGGGQRPAQLAKTFNKMGYLVFYLYAYGSNESTPQKDLPIPAVRHLHIDKVTIEAFLKRVKKNSLLIFELPHPKFKPYLDLAKKLNLPTIYEHIDNWETSLGNRFFKKEILESFLLDSTIISVTSKELEKQIRSYLRETSNSQVYLDKILYCPNAVDDDLFDPVCSRGGKPADLVQGEKTLLFYGSLWGSWLNWDLLIDVAKNCNCSINIIGDDKKLSVDKTTLPNNIYLLGLKKQKELPAYLYYSDILLLPFKNDEIGKYVSPLKIFEYLAMNKPVLSTRLEEVSEYPNVFTADTSDEWINFVNNPPPYYVNDKFTLQNNWYSRCATMLTRLEAAADNNLNSNHSSRIGNNAKQISVIVLNRNNKDIIFKCLDSLLQFRQHYNYEVIVVDNESSDGSPELIKESYGHKILMVSNSTNGCSSGRNLGIQTANGEIIVFLDSDQWVANPMWLNMPLHILKKRQDIGAVGWAAGWHKKTTESLPNRGVAIHELYRTDIGYLGTGGLVVSKDILNLVGGFDENYDPTGYEDTDLSFSIRNLGFELAYCPYMGIKHLRHQTTKTIGWDNYNEMLAHNNSYFLAKWERLNPQLLEQYFAHKGK